LTGGNNPERTAAGLADGLLIRVIMRKTVSEIGLAAMSCHRAILIFVMGLGLTVCPLTRAEQSVTLAWNPSPGSSVAGYVINYGSDGINYSNQVDAGNNTSWSVTGLQDGSTNYFEVSAYDTNHDESPPSAPVEYIAPAAAQLAANPVTNTVAISASPAVAGSVTGGGAYVTGSSVTVSATANSGYTFTSWTENGNVQSTSPSYSFNLAADCTLTANFTANSTLLIAAPAVTTQPATGVTTADATLNATVNPNLSATTVYFEYGSTTAYGNFSSTNTLASGLAGAQAVSVPITGIPPGAIVHFQAVAQNGLGVSFGGDLAFVTTAAGILFAPVPDQFVNVETPLVVTNTVSQLNGDGSGVTFNLGAGAPAGASISADGILQWTPACEQGSTTNLIIVWAIDNGNPSISNSVSFNVVVSACVQVTIGSSVSLTGDDASVPVTLYSTVSLTNVNFSLATLAGRFANWAAASASPDMVAATVEASDPSQPQFNFAVQSGPALLGALPLGTIGMHVLSAGDSAFAPLVANNVSATELDSTPVAPGFGQAGRVVLVGPQPLLEVSLTNSFNPLVTLYGNPGSNYVLLAANSLSAQAPWISFTNLTMGGTVQLINPGPLADKMVFFRAYRP